MSTKSRSQHFFIGSSVQPVRVCARGAWDFATIADTIMVFRGKWMPDVPAGGRPRPNTRVEDMLDELFSMSEEPAAEINDFHNISVSDDLLKAGGRCICRAASAGVPLTDILLALYVGSNVVDLKHFKTLSFIHQLAKRFIKTYHSLGHLDIPTAFLHPDPVPWRPVVHDDWERCEWACHEAGMQYLMCQAAGLEYTLPWSSTVVPRSDYRLPENDIGDELLTDSTCLLLMDAYTALILDSVCV